MNYAVKPNLEEFTDRIFDDIIGQEEVKSQFKFYLKSYIHSHTVPHFSIVAPKGQGKTKIARSIAKGLYEFDDAGHPIYQQSKTRASQLVPKRKTFVEINCSTIKNVKSFLTNVIGKYVQDKNVTVFFDESSELPADVSMALLTILEPNAACKTTFAYDDYTYEFDFKRQTFIFATTESHKVFHALSDRLEEISLKEYTARNLSDIVKINLPDVLIEDCVLEEIGTVLRGNARAAAKMANKIKIYLGESKVFMADDWASLKATLNIKPLGLSSFEIEVLQILAKHTQRVTLTALSATTGMSREQLRQESELMLLKHGLMGIEPGGRAITNKGLIYLRNLA